MLTDIHRALRRLLFEQGGIPAEVELRFEPPSRELVASLLGPTICCFLFDLAENTDLRQTSYQTTRANGQAQRRLPPRRFDLRYLVTVLTTNVEDEHLLLWRTLVTLLRNPVLPESVLPDTIRAIDPPLTGKIVPGDEGTRAIDLWSGFELPPRPALLYIVTAPVELDIAYDLPLVLTRTTRYTRTSENTVEVLGQAIGGYVRDEAGAPVSGVAVSVIGRGTPAVSSGPDGAFVLTGVPSGKILVESRRNGEPPVSHELTVPAASYDFVHPSRLPAGR